MTDGTDLIAAYTDAMNSLDLEAVLSFLSDDCVFEDTEPAPDGTRYEGKEAIRAAWTEMMTNSTLRFESEEVFEAGDRVIQRSKLSWDGGHVRGGNIFRLRDGKIVEMLCYVKG
jgi:ketosteroid isomerase-like protein